MLRISKKADYAVYLLGTIAGQGAYPGGTAEDSVLSAHAAARRVGLSKSVVANLLKDCARHGLLESVRGLRGGYRLCLPPSEVSLGQILEAVEGPFAFVDCCPDTGAAADPAPDRPLLPQTEGLQQTDGLQQTEDLQAHAADCALFAPSPTKQPMRLVHERIAKLFDEIHLDELCAMAHVRTPALTGAGERAGN